MSVHDVITANPAASAAPAERPEAKRFRAFTVSLLVASLLAAAAMVLSIGPLPTLTERIGAAVLMIGIWIAGAGVVTGRVRLLWVVLLTVALLGLFVAFAPAPPRSPRALHDAALLLYGAIAVAALLAPVRVIGEGRALLLTVSTAVVLFGADLVVTPPTPLPSAHLGREFPVMPDPDVDVRFVPNSTGRDIYPDNPRGYFEEKQPTLADTWSLLLQRGSEATLEHMPSDGGDIMRVAIRKRVGEDWTITLEQTGFQFTSGTSYLLTFRARSGDSRRISCQMSQNEAPWESDAEYREVVVGTEWRDFQCAFHTTRADTNGRVFFTVATSDAPIEFANVALHNQSTGRVAAPPLPPHQFFISYRFNSLGFRGPDYAVPRPPGTFRILALGDSYVQGIGVREPDTFEAVLQEHLNREAAGQPGAMHYEVINAGTSGYATRQELRSYELFSSRYEPQVVLLVMVFNDDMSFTEEVRRGLTPRGQDEGGLVNLMDRAKQSVRKYDYTDTVAALKELEAATKKRGAKLAVVIFTNEHVSAWDQMDAAVRAALAGTGVPLLNLKQAIIGDHPNELDLQVHRFDPHPNEIAHRIAAEQIERLLRTEHLLP